MRTSMRNTLVLLGCLLLLLALIAASPAPTPTPTPDIVKSTVEGMCPGITYYGAIGIGLALLVRWLSRGGS